MSDFAVWTKLCRLVVDAKSMFDEENIMEIDTEKTIAIRADMRRRVSEVSDLITQTQNSKISKYMTFALVVWLDEIMTEPYERASHPWPSLQQELYNTVDGGVTFYEYVDDVLANPFYPKIVYQFYASALREGFRGKYVHDQDHLIQSYLGRLQEVIGEDETEKNTFSPVLDQVVTSKKGLRASLAKLGNNHFGICLFGGVIAMYGVYTALLYVR